MEHTNITHTKLGWIDLALIVMVTIWGVNAVVVKLAYAQIAPATFMSLRFIIAPILLALILFLTDRSLIVSRRDWTWLAVAGLTGTTFYQPFFVLGKEITLVKVIGTVIILFGVNLVRTAKLARPPVRAQKTEFAR
jgi:drug/metabolite transporter (DMT)-like permease